MMPAALFSKFVAAFTAVSTIYLAIWTGVDPPVPTSSVRNNLLQLTVSVAYRQFNVDTNDDARRLR